MSESNGNGEMKWYSLRSLNGESYVAGVVDDHPRDWPTDRMKHFAPIALVERVQVAQGQTHLRYLTLPEGVHLNMRVIHTAQRLLDDDEAVQGIKARLGAAAEDAPSPASE